MVKTTRNQSGFSGIEVVLAVVIVAIVGSVGWYVYHTKQVSDKLLSTAATSASTSSKSSKSASSGVTPAGGTDNASLQADLNSASAGSAQSSKDLGGATASLNDTSTFTTVPQ